MTEEQSFESGEEYSYKVDSKLTFKIIVLRHFQAITDISRRLTSSPRDKYIKDEYGNAVDNLYDLLHPKFDKKAKEEIKEIDKEVLEINNEYNNLKTNDKYENRQIRKLRDKEIFILKRKLFRTLTSFLNKTHFLESKTYEDVGED